MKLFGRAKLDVSKAQLSQVHLDSYWNTTACAVSAVVRNPGDSVYRGMPQAHQRHCIGITKPLPDKSTLSTVSVVEYSATVV